MHFSEDDLREALKRKDPGEAFTQRVMARVNQSKAEDTAQPATKKVNGKFLAWLRVRPAWSFAVVAALLLGFAWTGYEYSEHRHEQLVQQERQRLEDLKRQQAEAERARDQAILALQIARSKLNHVLEQAQIPVAIDPTRRQRL
jgi:type VI protein secretion system component VasF